MPRREVPARIRVMPRKRKPPPPGAPAVPPEDVPLNDTERRFLTEYLVDENGVRAYMTIHPDSTYKNAAEQSCKLRKKPNVAAELKGAREAAARRCKLRADNSLRENGFIAHSDIIDLVDPETNRLLPIRKIPLATRRAIKKVRVRRERVDRSTTTVRRGAATTVTVDTTIHEQELEYEFHSKDQAIAREFRYLGMEQSIPPLDAVLALLPADLAAQVRDALAAGDKRGTV